MRLGDVPREEDDPLGVERHEAALEAPLACPRAPGLPRLVLHDDEALLVEGRPDAVEEPVRGHDRPLGGGGAILEDASLAVEGEEVVGKCRDEGAVLGLARLELLQLLAELRGGAGDAPPERGGDDEKKEEEGQDGDGGYDENPEVGCL